MLSLWMIRDDPILTFQPSFQWRRSTCGYEISWNNSYVDDFHKARTLIEEYNHSNHYQYNYNTLQYIKHLYHFNYNIISLITIPQIHGLPFHHIFFFLVGGPSLHPLFPAGPKNGSVPADRSGRWPNSGSTTPAECHPPYNDSGICGAVGHLNLKKKLQAEATSYGR